MATLQTNLTNLAVRVATECKSLRTMINGNTAGLSSLTTTAKSSLVAAINELNSAIAASSSINDAVTGTASTWSSDKISDELVALKANILGGASSAVDTLQELATLIAENDGDLTNLLTAVGNRVRFDAAQTLTAPQKAQALSNIGAASDTHTHPAATTGAAGLMSAEDKAKLDGVAASANNYVHPATDGNRHVPATAAGDVNKFLKANPAAGGNPSWATPTKADVGLGSVDNTSDANKPVSTAQQTALNGKSDTAHGHNNATSSVSGFMASTDKAKLDAIAAGAEVNQNAFTTIAVSGQSSVVADSKTDTLTLASGAGIAITTDAATDTVTIAFNGTKSTVGLSNVDNTSDANKPVSTAQQTALNLKADLSAFGTIDTDYVSAFEAGLV